MESQRQKRVAQQLQRDLGEIFQREMQHHFGKAFITVTEVRVTADLSIASVYLSFMLVKDKQEALREVEAQNKTIRHALGRRVGKQMRIVPELRFYLDDTAERAAHIEDLLSKIDVPPAEDDPADEPPKRP